MRRSNKYPGMYPKPGILSYLREQNHVTQAELAAYLSKAIDEKYDYKVRSHPYGKPANVPCLSDITNR